MRTGRFLIKRLIYIIFVFFIISILMFAIYKSLPGDPVRMMMQGNIKPEVYQQQYEITRKQLGLDQPVPVIPGILPAARVPATPASPPAAWEPAVPGGLPAARTPAVPWAVTDWK